MLGAVAAGDTVRWVIGDTTSGSGDGKRTHVLVKPFAAGQSTNASSRPTGVSIICR
jgi:type IV secretory pathway VirB9-like protein